MPSSISMGSAGGSRFAAQRSSHSVAGTLAGSGGGGGLKSQRKSISLQVMAAKNAGTPRLGKSTRELLRCLGSALLLLQLHPDLKVGVCVHHMQLSPQLACPWPPC